MSLNQLSEEGLKDILNLFALLCIHVHPGEFFLQPEVKLVTFSISSEVVKETTRIHRNKKLDSTSSKAPEAKGNTS